MKMKWAWLKIFSLNTGSKITELDQKHYHTVLIQVCTNNGLELVYVVSMVCERKPL